MLTLPQLLNSIHLKQKYGSGRDEDHIYTYAERQIENWYIYDKSSNRYRDRKTGRYVALKLKVQEIHEVGKIRLLIRK